MAGERGRQTPDETTRERDGLLSTSSPPETHKTESLTRLGIWGETTLAIVMVIALLYLFTLSHKSSGFSQRPLLLPVPENSWAQPRQEARNWLEQHSLYVSKVAVDGPELLFYGDSIFELLRGTMHMEPDPRGHGIPEVFHKHFGQTYKAGVLGIAGDQTSQLMWRLKHGEEPRQTTKAIVLLIGTNDLTHASFQGDDSIPAAANRTTHRIQSIVQQLRSAAPDASILLMGLLPRGDQTLMPDPAMFALPSKFSQAIEDINSRLDTFAASTSHTTFLDCGEGFLSEDKSALNVELMPDALHPSHQGMEVLCQCLKPAVQQIMGH